MQTWPSFAGYSSYLYVGRAVGCPADLVSIDRSISSGTVRYYRVQWPHSSPSAITTSGGPQQPLRYHNPDAIAPPLRCLKALDCTLCSERGTDLSWLTHVFLTPQCLPPLFSTRRSRHVFISSRSDIRRRPRYKLFMTDLLIVCGFRFQPQLVATTPQSGWRTQVCSNDCAIGLERGFDV